MPVNTNNLIDAVEKGITNTINLAGSNLTDTNIKSLIDKIIAKKLPVRRLILNSNKISNKGLLHICELLKNDCCQLNELDISASTSNDLNFTKESMQALFEAIMVKNTLKILSMRSNRLSESCGQVILDNVSRSQLIEIGLSLNPISARLNDAIKAKLKINESAQLKVNNTVSEFLLIDSDEIIESVNEINSELINTSSANSLSKYDYTDDTVVTQNILQEVHQDMLDERIKEFHTAALLAYFKNHPNLERFYTRLHARLKSLFLACQVAASEYFSTNKTNLQGKVGTVLEVLSPLFSAIPFIGGVFSAVLSGAGKAALNADQLRQASRLTNIAKHFSPRNPKSLVAQVIAIALTLRYAAQLNELPLQAETAPSLVNAADEALKRLTSENLLAHRLAEEVFRHLVEIAVQQDDLKFTEASLATEFLRSYNRSFSLLERVFNVGYNVGRQEKIITKSGKEWEYSKILTAPYIVTEQRQIYFDSQKSDLNYGYQYVHSNVLETEKLVASSSMHLLPESPINKLLTSIEADVKQVFGDQLRLSSASTLTSSTSSASASPPEPNRLLSSSSSSFFNGKEPEDINHRVDCLERQVANLENNNRQKDEEILDLKQRLERLEQMMLQFASVPAGAMIFNR